MTDLNQTVAGLTLPPKVVGKTCGHLVMKVDEVLWARKPPGEVSAVILWWGSEEPTTFRPADVSEGAVKRKNVGVIYEIRTSLSLFEKYLHRCCSLEIAMADKYGMPIGCASVTKLWQMINTCPYQGYYPIVNKFGNRIGDLHVSFNLRMLANVKNTTVTKLCTKPSLKTKELKRLAPTKNKEPPASCKSKEEKTKTNEKVLKDFYASQEVIADPPVQECESGNNDSDEYFVNVVSQESVQNSLSPTSNIISQILEHGTRLRDAMTASVMEDGIHLGLKSIPPLNALSCGSEILSDKRLPFKAESLYPPVEGDRLNVFRGSHIPCEKKRNPVVEKKVLDYLSGKPMSQIDQEQALAALRSVTPTKDVLDDVVPETYPESESKESLSRNVNSKKDLEIVTNTNDNRENSCPVNDVTRAFEVDSHLLSQINCLRITVQSLVLNSVGIKRVGSYPKKKDSHNHSNNALHPPGVSFFVEYKFPFVAGSRPWESDVCYCSKRFNDHEVTFGVRTIHNLPETWRSSISKETNLGTLISALSFKVCARHLHQRVPVLLGSASPDSAGELIESTHLRHDFNLPVIASDCLPVAQLRICLELGRDRIHFGGLFDPENNSLGVGSPRNASSASRKIKPSSTTTTKKKLGRSVTTVTRDISSTLTSPTYKWKTVIPPLKATQAERVIKRLVADASEALKSSRSSSSSSATSSSRPKLKPSNIKVPIKNQVSAFMRGGSSTFVKPSLNGLFMKHELAVALLQVIGTDYLAKSTTDDIGFYITYKFPVFNAMKNDSVEWCPCSTEPSEGTDGTWQRTQSKIHTIVLPQTKSFHTFLQHAFKFQGTHRKSFVFFALNVRCYGNRVQDSLISEAYLPLSSILTLENAYNEASRSNPNFSKTSCSSVVLELPFEHGAETTGNNCRLRLKLDYRHCLIEQPAWRENLPRSRGDSVTENLPYHNFVKSKDTRPKLLPEGEVEVSRSIGSPLNFPNWVKFPPSNLGGTVHLEGNVNQDFYHTADLNQSENPFAKGLHASWEPLEKKTNSPQQAHKMMQDSAYQLNLTSGLEDTKSIDDVIHITKGMNQCELQNSQLAMHKGSQPFSSLDSQDSLCQQTPKNVRATTCNAMKEATTSNICSAHQRHTFTRGTSPMQFSELSQGESGSQYKLTSTERVPDQKDSSQQTTIQNVSQGSQTTPRESKEVPRRDVGTSANIIELLPENKDKISTTTELTAGVFPCHSIDDMEIIQIASEEDFETQICKEISNEENFTRTSSERPILQEEDPHFSTKDISNFKVATFDAKIGVECALHLETSYPSFNQRGQNVKSFVFVSINSCSGDGHVSAHMGLNPVSISPAVINNGEPEWNWKTEVQLPVDLLVSTVKRLIFKIWSTEKALQEENSLDHKSASLIGFSALDLTVLSAGLPVISGWYNILDFSGACHGQIKLSVKPLESVSKIVNLSSLPSTNATQIDSPLSMFVAHCTYPEFPSHVTQFPDIRIHKLALHPANEAMPAVPSHYQLVLQHCQRLNCETLVNLQESSIDNQVCRINSAIPLQRKGKNTALDVLPSEARDNCNKGLETASTPSLNQNTDNFGSGSVLEVYKDPSILLREKLSELDTITKTFKARLLTSVESAQGLQASSQPACKHIVNGNELFEAVPCTSDSPSGTCMCNLNGKEGKDKEGTGAKQKPAAGNDTERKSECVCNEKPSVFNTGNEQRNVFPKQRKTWERQEDLIDFGALSMEDGGEQSPHPEDLSEWLTESALQDVFNPFLFNSILNKMNSSRGVQVIELNDTETSDDNQDSTAPPSHRANSSPLLVEGRDTHSESYMRRSWKGDETYRKEMPQFSHNQSIPEPHRRRGPAACDADSGVDVDLSANFHPGACFGLAGVHHEPCFAYPRSAVGGWTASSEREESSSCSLSSSRHHRSTMPSSVSASATPSDSPLHSHPVHKGFQNESCGLQGTLEEKQCVSSGLNQSRTKP